MLEPAVRTRATATLPKLPSPISLMTSNRSSRVAIDVGAALRVECSYETVMLPVPGWGVCVNVCVSASREN